MHLVMFWSQHSDSEMFVNYNGGNLFKKVVTCYRSFEQCMVYCKLNQTLAG